MVGLSRADLCARLLVAGFVACLALCRISTVSSAMVSTAVRQHREANARSPSLAATGTSTSSTERIPNSNLASASLTAEGSDHFNSQHFQETKDSKANHHNQRIQKNKPILTERHTLLDDSLTLTEDAERKPSRLRIARAAESVPDDGLPVAEKGFLTKRVESLDTNSEGSGADPPSDDTTGIVADSTEGSRSESRSGVSNADCPECIRRKQEMEKLSPEKLRLMRLEQIKRRILSKLELEQAPNVSASSVDIPEPLARGRLVGDHLMNDVLGTSNEERTDSQDETWEEDELNNLGDRYEETNQVIITAQEGLGACSQKTPSTGCFSFEISARVEENIVSAKLWFLLTNSGTEINENRTLVVSHIGSGRHTHRSVIQTSTVVYKADWSSVDLTHAVRRIAVHAKRTYSFEISCTTCYDPGNPIETKPGRRPFLVLGKGERHSRTPRSVTCLPNHTTCCKEIFYVSFAELKWDWIIEPKGYTANYCRGSCDDNVAQGYGHTFVMSTVRNMDVDRGLSIIPCCAPLSTSPLVLIYYDNKGFIYKKILQNMITDSCACM